MRCLLTRYSRDLSERPHELAVLLDGQWVVSVEHMDDLLSLMEPGQSLHIHLTETMPELEIYDPDEVMEPTHFDDGAMLKRIYRRMDRGGSDAV